MSIHLDSAFEKFRPYLHLLAKAHIGDALKTKLDASDIVQQTMLQAHKNRDGFRGNSEGELVAWLKKILTNRILENARHWKLQKRDMARDVALEQKIDDSFRRADHWLAASHTSPSMAVHGNDMLIKLSSAIEKLPDDLQRVVVMHHLQGMKLVEIAKAVECNETTVGRRLFRGIQQLSQLMKEE